MNGLFVGLLGKRGFEGALRLSLEVQNTVPWILVTEGRRALRNPNWAFVSGIAIAAMRRKVIKCLKLMMMIM